jgi:NTP pyrophosphatase (non-canonical NTP hydrolase)
VNKVLEEYAELIEDCQAYVAQGLHIGQDPEVVVDLAAEVLRLEAENATLQADARLGALVRPEVRAFALAMEERLKANDHKGGWKDCDPNYCLNRLYEEASELVGAILTVREVGREAILQEAADVANFAMMLADVCAALGEETPC